MSNPYYCTKCDKLANPTYTAHIIEGRVYDEFIVVGVVGACDGCGEPLVSGKAAVQIGTDSPAQDYRRGNHDQNHTGVLL